MLIIDVSATVNHTGCLRSDIFTVHSEPGEEKVKYANDVADWILARVNADSNEAKARL